MSHFTKKVTKTYEFEDDTVTVTMRRLKKKDAIKLAPMLGEPDEEGKFKISFVDQMKFMGEAGPILIKYVDDFSGLKDAEGNSIGIEDACGDDSEAYFMTLLSEMFSDLMENGFSKGKADEKKSDRQSRGTSEVTDTLIASTWQE